MGLGGAMGGESLAAAAAAAGLSSTSAQASPLSLARRPWGAISIGNEHSASGTAGEFRQATPGGGALPVTGSRPTQQPVNAQPAEWDGRGGWAGAGERQWGGGG